MQTALHSTVREAADELLTIELDRLDAWLVRLNEQIEAGRGVARHIEVALKVSERRARLLGLDAPTKGRVEVITLDAIDEQIRPLEAELAGHDPDCGAGG